MKPRFDSSRGYQIFACSSNGRTEAFDSSNLGSNPKQASNFNGRLTSRGAGPVLKTGGTRNSMGIETAGLPPIADRLVMSRVS